MTEAEKTNILEWMDKQIELNKAIISAKHCGSRISACTGSIKGEIFMFRGLDELSKATGKKIGYEECSSGGYHLFVRHKDHKFYTLNEAR